MDLTEHAYQLLKDNPTYLADAKAGAASNNTVAGSVMAMTTGSPRWATENAVKEALARILKETKRRAK